MRWVGGEEERNVFRRIYRFQTQTWENCIIVSGTENVEKAREVRGGKERVGDQVAGDRMKSEGKTALGRRMPSLMLELGQG